MEAVQSRERGAESEKAAFSSAASSGFLPLDSRRSSLDFRLASEIVRQLAQAVEHAHLAGILHRDIKPANVLLDPARSSGSLPFTPMLIDFGLAKLVDGDAAQTATGLVLGTPRYMAPEQATGRAKAAGPAADIYALGVLLYELLTGRAPFEGSDSADTLRRLLTDAPRRPRQVHREIPRDLEAICLKCLEKSPQRRYRTAGDLADDLGRSLAGTPTIARPMGTAERVWRWGRRHPSWAALLFVVAFSALGAIGGLVAYTTRVTQLLHDAQQARREAEESERSLWETLYVGDIRLAARASQNGDPRQAHMLLTRYLPESGKPDRRGIEWHYLWEQTRHPTTQSVEVSSGPLYMVRFSPEGRLVGTCGRDGLVRLYDATTYQPVATWDAGQGELNGIDFAPGGQRCATAGDDGTVRVWDLATRNTVTTIDAHPDLAYHVLFSRDGKQLISCGTSR